MLKLSKLSKTFSQPGGDVRVLDSVDFHLLPAKSAALLGESGSGKSTMLHLITGLDKPDSGDIIFNGDVVTVFDERQWNRLRRTELSLILPS